MQPPNPFVFPAWQFWPYAMAGGLCIVIGLYFALRPPRRNPWGGTRVRWTYADEQIWEATQRLTGWLCVAAGVGFLLWLPVGIVMVIALALGATLYARAKYMAKYGTSRTWHGGKGMIDYRPVAKCPNCGHLNELQSAEDLALARCEQCRHPLQK